MIVATSLLAVSWIFMLDELLAREGIARWGVLAHVAADVGLVTMAILMWSRAGSPGRPSLNLVVAGVYRHVRNPMISGVVLILLGEALALLSRGLLNWALGFLVVNLIYIPLLEEPMLVGRFGDEYRQYKQHVPRWVPRRTAWAPPWR